MQDLRQRIRAAIQAKDLPALGAATERLLVLLPADEETQRLAGQLRGQLLRGARQKLQNRQYAMAVRLLGHVPETLRDAEYERCRQKAAELHWLSRDLQVAPVADATLRAVAERLVRLAPGDPDAPRLLEKVCRRLDEPPRDPRAAAPSWNPPELRCWDFPCSGWAGSAGCRAPPPRPLWCGSIPAGSSPRAAWRSRASAGPRSMSTWRRRRRAPDSSACRFAAANRPGRRGDWIWATRRSRPPCWRIDETGQTIRIEALELFEYPGAEHAADDTATRREKLLAALGQFRVGRDLEETRLCVGLSGQRLLGRTFDLPPVDEKRLADTVLYELQKQIPLPLDLLAWRYRILRRPGPGPDAAATWRITVQAAKQHHVQELLELCRESGLTVDAVQGDCLALHNLAQYELADVLTGSEAAADAGQTPAIALLDVGGQTSNLIVSAPRRCGSATWRAGASRSRPRWCARSTHPGPGGAAQAAAGQGQTPERRVRSLGPAADVAEGRSAAVAGSPRPAVSRAGGPADVRPGRRLRPARAVGTVAGRVASAAADASDRSRGAVLTAMRNATMRRRSLWLIAAWLLCAAGCEMSGGNASLEEMKRVAMARRQDDGAAKPAASADSPARGQTAGRVAGQTSACQSPGREAGSARGNRRAHPSPPWPLR